MKIVSSITFFIVVSRTLLLVVILLPYTCFPYDQTYSVIAGFSLAGGKGTEHMKPGFNVGLGSTIKPVDFLGIGWYAGYALLLKKYTDDWGDKHKTIFHFIEVLAPVRWYRKIAGDTYFLGEIGPEFILNIRKTTIDATDPDDNLSSVSLKPYFCISLGTGIAVGNVLFLPRYKYCVSKNSSIQWFNISVGIFFER